MGARKKKRRPKNVRRRERWWNAFRGWNPNQGMGKGWRLIVRKAAGAQSNFKKKKGQ